MTAQLDCNIDIKSLSQRNPTLNDLTSTKKASIIYEKYLSYQKLISNIICSGLYHNGAGTIYPF